MGNLQVEALRLEIDAWAQERTGMKALGSNFVDGST
jgi:hypothetical protein